MCEVALTISPREQEYRAAWPAFNNDM